jgi:hypothetical protein
VVGRPERCSRVASVVIVAAVLVGGCGDYSVCLPNGFSMVRVYPGAVHVVRPNHEGIAIFANVDEYAVLGDYVVGHVDPPKHELERSMSKPGYFILNTSSGDAKDAMDLDAWRAELRRSSLATDPALARPSRFHDHCE